MLFILRPIGWTSILAVILTQQIEATAAETQLELRVWEHRKDDPVPARLHLRDESGTPVKPARFPSWDDHFVFPGVATLTLPPGRYDYELERGPEYQRQQGSISLVADKTTPLDLRLKRLVDMKSEGWWSGDLHVHRPPSEISLLAEAEDLQIAPVITWWNKTNPWQDHPLPNPRLLHFGDHGFSDLLAGEDEREGGALLYFNVPAPLAIQKANREYPSPMQFLAEAHQAFPAVHVDIEKPFWWDVPVWLASGLADTMGLANNHMCRRQMLANEAWGNPRDPARLPPPLGNGFWSQEIYYHILNTGLRLPPSAGSASGVLPNPVGYNRVYVNIEGDFTHEQWWESLRQGRSFVSNGPLLRVQANGFFPGHIFSIEAGQTLTLDLEAKLTTQDKIPAFEIIQNGRVLRKVPMTEWQKTGSLGKVSFRESGWFLVRVLADRPETFRFASTAPWYVQVKGSPPRISRASVQFFLNWMEQRMERINVPDPTQRESVLRYHREARTFWEKRLASATTP